MTRLCAAALLVATLAAPAFAQDERSWNLVVDEEVASLTFAIPESDDAGPTFSCTPGEGSVHVLYFVDHRIATEEPNGDGEWVDASGAPAPWAGQLTLSSGGIAETLEAQVHPDEMNGGSMIDAETNPETPLMAAFGKSGRITLSSFGESETPPPARPADVRALLKACLPGS